LPLVVEAVSAGSRWSEIEASSGPFVGRALPFVAAAKALLAEGHAPETEIAMQHKGSTILAIHGKIGTLTAFTEGPLPETGSQGGDLDVEGVALHEPRKAVLEPVTCRSRHSALSPDALPRPDAVHLMM
jgi:hypothetical protein